ncbi:hypothetical protein M407DRAFT_34760 [Tulasnella calospora MUT 4182]|uniref:Uncharacterized protein n=1 Tax=Tulasnella calospora MUT 4182 TaxID=1051891 RepID=A0A0C3Q0T6_9AGAM|nr:hypothetical protein M407DRAFT_34760 [Tulasnella calospora MUT 4182]
MSTTEATEQKSDGAQAVDEEYEKLERFHVEGRRIVLIDKNHKSEGGPGIVRRGELYRSAYPPAWLDSRLYGPPQLMAVKQIKVSDFNTMARAKRGNVGVV